MGYILGLLVALPVVVICGMLIYVVSKAKKEPQEPALTPRDLQVLQESAEELVRSITSAADESMRRFDTAKSELEDLISRAEKAAQFLEARLGPPDQHKSVLTDKVNEAVRLRSNGLDTADIARQLDMASGEVELLLNLRPKLGAVSSK